MGRELHKTEPLDLGIAKIILQSKGGRREGDSINLYFKNCAIYQASVLKNKWMELGGGLWLIRGQNRLSPTDSELGSEGDRGEDRPGN